MLLRQDHGPTALGIIARQQQQAQDEATLITNVRQRLRLRRLLRDELLPMSDFKACIRRLLQHKDVLQPWLEGLSIRVSDANRVTEEGQVIDIAWNFKF